MMLYDPKWEQKTQVNPYSLASLIAWLEKQRGAKSYNYLESHQCLIAQYLIAVGEADYELPSCQIEKKFGRAVLDVVEIHPWTFGAALERARVALAKGDR